MIPFMIPLWLQDWAERNGHDWKRWSHTEALYWEEYARSDGGWR